MTRKPIFPDCAFPEDCQCAARGYEHEMESCAVPGVAAAAKLLGMPSEGLFRPNRTTSGGVMTYGILIDPTMQTITEVTWDDGLTGLQRLVGGYIEVAYGFSLGDVLYVNEEGILYNLTPWRFLPRPDQPLFGPGLVVGREINEDGMTARPISTVASLTKQVRWLR
jgi:hypothetical protein